MNDYFDQRTKSEVAADENALAIPEQNAVEADNPTETSGDSDPTETTGLQLKAAVQELMKFGLLEDATKPNLYRIIRERLPDARKILEPFDLAIELDDVRGIAFLKIADVVNKDPDEAWSHPLVRRQRLTSEQSLLVAILRQAYIAYEQEYGLGADGARIDFDELQTQFDTYFGNSGSEAGDRERLSRVITQLHSHSIVSEPDKENQIRIRPIIVHLANPEQLRALLRHFEALAVAYPVDFTETSDEATPPDET